MFIFFFFFRYRSNLKINQYYVYFGVALKKWLSIVRNKLIHRIEYHLDQDTPLLTHIKLTTLSSDISNCFTQIIQFWKRLGNNKNMTIVYFLFHKI